LDGSKTRKRRREDHTADDPRANAQQERLEPRAFKDHHLQELFRQPDKRLRDHQQRVLKLISSGFHEVVYITATGQGKSISYLLPANVNPDGVTVVIQPHRSLQMDSHAKMN
jgi:superfamily II DNA helicase RecQ